MERVIFTRKRISRGFSASVGTACLALGMLAQPRTAIAPKATVLLFLSTDCPISAKYTSRINALYEKFATRGVSFEALFPNDLETTPSVGAYMTERNYQFPYAIDL